MPLGLVTAFHRQSNLPGHDTCCEQLIQTQNQFSKRRCATSSEFPSSECSASSECSPSSWCSATHSTCVPVADAATSTRAVISFVTSTAHLVLMFTDRAQSIATVANVFATVPSAPMEFWTATEHSRSEPPS